MILDFYDDKKVTFDFRGLSSRLRLRAKSLSPYKMNLTFHLTDGSKIVLCFYCIRLVLFVDNRWRDIRKSFIIAKNQCLILLKNYIYAILLMFCL